MRVLESHLEGRGGKGSRGGLSDHRILWFDDGNDVKLRVSFLAIGTWNASPAECIAHDVANGLPIGLTTLASSKRLEEFRVGMGIVVKRYADSRNRRTVADKVGLQRSGRSLLSAGYWN